MATESVTLEDVLDWLDGIAAGTIDLGIDNQALANAAHMMLSGTDPMPEALPEDHLSPNFTLYELTYSDTAVAEGIVNVPDPEETEQLTMLAAITLEGIRSICGGKELVISSGFRCEELNELVGGAPDSAHKFGCAADFVIPSFGTPSQICEALKPHLMELEIDQLIDECDSDGNRWVHVGRAIPPNTVPRYECFAINA